MGIYIYVCVFISLSYHWIGLRDVFLRETTIFHGNKIWFPVDVPLNQSNDMWDFHGIEPSTKNGSIIGYYGDNRPITGI